ncbi:MAG: PIN domain-containing protein [Microbacterium sp.]
MSGEDVGVADTSVMIALVSGRPFDSSRMPDSLVTTVVTRAELEVGVLAAPNAGAGARRLATLDQLSTMTILPATTEAAHAWARLRVHLRERGTRMEVNDLWIAAIATANELPIVTQDADFDALDGVPGVTVIRV